MSLVTYAPLSGVALLVLAVAGCALVLGGDFAIDETPTTTSGAGAGGTGSAGGGADGGGLSLQWEKRFGDPHEQEVWTLGVDRNGPGNISIGGRFKGTIDLGAGPLEAGSDGWDIFLASLDPAGTHRWSHRFGTTGERDLAALAVDAAGNVVIVGSFTGTITFGTATLASQGAPDGYVAKLDSQGNALWSRRYGAQGQQVLPYAVACGESGQIFVAGIYKGTVDFGGGPVAGGGPFDVFVVEHDSAGLHQADMHFPGLGASTYPVAVGVAGTEVLLAGSFGPSIDLGGTVLTGDAEGDGYVARLEWSSLKVGAVQQATGKGAQLLWSVVADGEGNALGAGVFDDALDWGAGTAVTAGGFDALLAKLGPSGGAPLWSRTFGSSANDTILALALDPTGGIVTAGAFSLPLDLGGGLLAHVDGMDLFVAGFGPDGTHRYQTVCGGPDDQWAPRMAVDGNGDVLLAATFRDSMTCGATPLAAAGASDVFLAKLRP